MDFFERISDLLKLNYNRNVRYPFSMIFPKAHASVLDFMEFEMKEEKPMAVLFKDHSKEAKETLDFDEQFQGLRLSVRKKFSSNFNMDHSVSLGTSQSKDESRKNYRVEGKFVKKNISLYGALNSDFNHESIANIKLDNGMKIEVKSDSQSDSLQQKNFFSASTTGIVKETPLTVETSYLDSNFDQEFKASISASRRYKDFTGGLEYSFSTLKKHHVSGFVRYETHTVSDLLYNHHRSRKYKATKALNGIDPERLDEDLRREYETAIFVPRVVLTLSASKNRLHANYINFINDKFRLSTDLLISSENGSPYTSRMRTGFLFTSKHTTLKGGLTNFSEINSSFTTRLNPFIIATYTAHVNFPTETYKFGLGLTFDL